MPTLPALVTDIYWWKTLLTGDEISNYLTAPATEAAIATATAEAATSTAEAATAGVTTTTAAVVSDATTTETASGSSAAATGSAVVSGSSAAVSDASSAISDISSSSAVVGGKILFGALLFCPPPHFLILLFVTNSCFYSLCYSFSRSLVKLFFFLCSSTYSCCRKSIQCCFT